VHGRYREVLADLDRPAEDQNSTGRPNKEFNEEFNEEFIDGSILNPSEGRFPETPCQLSL